MLGGHFSARIEFEVRRDSNCFATPPRMWEERFAVLRGFGRVRLVRDPSVSMRRLGESPPPQSHPSSRPILVGILLETFHF